MKSKSTLLPLLLLGSILTLSCNDDNEGEPEVETFLCCGQNPFANSNINNLDQAFGAIEPVEFFTPNGDGYNDHFEIQNIEFYENNTVTIYDLEDNIVFETQSYNNIDETVFPQNPTENSFIGENQITNSELEFGTYKYKIIIENEDTFLRYGYLCFIREAEQANGMGFYDCIESPFDPILP